jgi:hypothetical protein
MQREDKERAKARRAAGKQAKPLWEEDGKRRGLLDKYDEEEEQSMQVSAKLWRRSICSCFFLGVGGRAYGGVSGRADGATAELRRQFRGFV